MSPEFRNFAADAGAHVATIPFAVLEQMFKHPLTDIGLKRFLEDWERVKAALAARRKGSVPA